MFFVVLKTCTPTDLNIAIESPKWGRSLEALFTRTLEKSEIPGDWVYEDWSSRYACTLANIEYWIDVGSFVHARGLLVDGLS